MKTEPRLKLQAYVDGETNGREAREIAEWLARDPGARALREELQSTRDALRRHQSAARLPVSGDFYWSRIRQRITPAEQARPAFSPQRWLARWWKYLIPAGALALFAFMVSLQYAPRVSLAELSGMEVQTELPGATVMTYRSDTEGISVVWIQTP